MTEMEYTSVGTPVVIYLFERRKGSEYMTSRIDDRARHRAILVCHTAHAAAVSTNRILANQTLEGDPFRINFSHSGITVPGWCDPPWQETPIHSHADIFLALTKQGAGSRAIEMWRL